MHAPFSREVGEERQGFAVGKGASLANAFVNAR